MPLTDSGRQNLCEGIVVPPKNPVGVVPQRLTSWAICLGLPRPPPPSSSPLSIARETGDATEWVGVPQITPFPGSNEGRFGGISLRRKDLMRG